MSDAQVTYTSEPVEADARVQEVLPVLFTVLLLLSLMYVARS